MEARWEDEDLDKGRAGQSILKAEKVASPAPDTL